MTQKIKEKLDDKIKKFSKDEKDLLCFFASNMTQEEIVAKVGIEIASRLGNTVKKFQKETSSIFEWTGNAQYKKDLLRSIFEEYYGGMPRTPDAEPPAKIESQKTPTPAEAAEPLTFGQLMNNYKELESAINDCGNLIKMYQEKRESLKVAKKEIEETLWIPAK